MDSIYRISLLETNEMRELLRLVSLQMKLCWERALPDVFGHDALISLEPARRKVKETACRDSLGIKSQGWSILWNWESMCEDVVGG